MFRTKQSLQSRLHCNPLLSWNNVTLVLANHQSPLTADSKIPRTECGIEEDFLCTCFKLASKWRGSYTQR